MITMTFVPRGRNARARQAVQTLEFPVLACFFHLLLPPPPQPLIFVIIFLLLRRLHFSSSTLYISPSSLSYIFFLSSITFSFSYFFSLLIELRDVTRQQAPYRLLHLDKQTDKTIGIFSIGFRLIG